MGFDISYHPIKLEQMEEWYFNRLDEVKNGDYSKIQDIAKKAGIEEFYIDKYIDTMKVAAGTSPDDNFEKTHAFNIAVVQGFFLPYHYNRGTGFSFLIEENPGMAKYTTPWQNIIPQSIKCPIEGKIFENYCGGVFISPEQVNAILSDYETDDKIKNIIDNFFEQNLPAFIKALKYSSENGLGLLEATDVVEPNPTDLNKTTSLSNLFNCDPEGAFIYQETALKQIEEYLKAHGNNSDPNEAMNNAGYNRTVHTEKDTESKKGGFFKKLFKK